MKPLQYLALVLMTLGAGLFTVVRFQHQTQAQTQQAVVLLPYAAADYKGAAYKGNIVSISVYARVEQKGQQTRTLLAELQPQELTEIAALQTSIPTVLQVPLPQGKAKVTLETEVAYDSDGTVLTIRQENQVKAGAAPMRIPLAV